MIGRRWYTPWLWLSPALLLLAAFLVYPTVDTVRRSLLDERSRAFVGLDNYIYIAQNPQPFVANTHAALANNALWLVTFTGLTVALGLGIAVLAGHVRYEPAAKAALFVPMAISYVAAAVIWRFMYDFDPAIGTVNAVATRVGLESTAWLQDTGAPQTWLTDLGPDRLPAPLSINNLALIVVGVWMWTGFAVVVFSAGLKGIPDEILEAARVDGADGRRIFRHITVPLLWPTIVVVATTLVIQALKTFDLVWVMTGGQFRTDLVATLFFKMLFITRDFGVGAAMAVLLFLAVVPVMVLGIRRFQFGEEAG